jgi:alpha-L-rhamnosidase
MSNVTTLPCKLGRVLALLLLLPAPFAVAASHQAQWIAPAATTKAATGIFDFRKIISLNASPRQCVVHVSADNRFQLYVNGQRVGEGPARGDLQHWRYEEFDIAPLLHKGTNVIAARVWNFGDQTPAAQISLRTGFLLWTTGNKESTLNTDASWQVHAEQAWRYEPTGPPLNSLTGPGEILDGSKYDWRWTDARDATSWSAAVVIAAPQFAPSGGPAPTAANWMLTPDTLPAMESKPAIAGKVVRSVGVSTTAFPDQALTIAPHMHVSLLLDRGVLTTAYPQLAVSDGTGAHIRLTYAEALYDDHGEKGNRNQIVGKHMDPKLLHDTYLPSGDATVQTFEPLWWRTWRYLQVDVDTEDKPVTLQSLHSRTTSYPFQERASFHSSDPELEAIWQVGWRTARVNAHETYMDCPYFEQTQYIGDTRIEALVSYAMSGDDRLARQALISFADSALPSGLTQSRFPAQGVQVIPPFSLLWIGMLHDFWMYRPDADTTVRQLLPQTRAVLQHFQGLQRADGLLGKLPQDGLGLWNFLDWTKPYPIGAPPEDPDGGSVPLSLQLASALRDEADLEAAFGDAGRADDDRTAATRITTAAFAEAWEADLGLLADTPARTSFSQHANILGVLTGAIPQPQQHAVLETILQGEPGGQPRGSVSPLAPASYYFRFYLARALDHAGMDDLYLQTLWPWHNMLELGLTTWAEAPEPTRSDAHAWSSHPNYDLLTLVAGIRPDAPRFDRVLIAPHLGSLTWLEATMPHPRGDIRVSYRREGGSVDATIELPPGLEGRFQVAGKEQQLHSGVQHFLLQTP